MHKILHLFNALRLWILFLLVRKNNRFKMDLKRWSDWKKSPYKNTYLSFVFLMSEYKVFRNVCYYRMGRKQYFCKWLCRPLDSLYIHCKDIGGGFLIQHGFATIINANKIGENAHIYQQVTIGYNGDKRPIIGDNVRICCGAKVIGGVTIDNNVIVGAQALVIKDVPSNVVVGGVPAKILKSID